ncbi:FtsQ-type POTRA domain-containing protein [Parasphingorhabdus pacifica]
MVPPVVLTVLTIAVVVVYFTPVLGVRSVEVEGNEMLGDQEVRAAAGVRMGVPMLRVDSDEIGGRLRRMRELKSVDVSLAWPSTVRLEVVERVPAVYMVGADGVHLVDASGTPFRKVPERPPALPELKVNTAAPDDPATRAALAALTSLGPEVRAEVVAVEVKANIDVRLLLTGDRQVEWGENEQVERKAAILPPLLTRPGKTYDVTSPELPTVA